MPHLELNLAPTAQDMPDMALALRHVAATSTVTSHHCEILFRSMADLIAGNGTAGLSAGARAGRGSYPFALGVGLAGHSLAGVVGSGQRQRDVAGLRGKVLWWPGLVPGPAGQGPFGIGVGEAPGAQGEVPGITGVIRTALREKEGLSPVPGDDS